MLFSALFTLPLLSLTFANPLPNAETAELQLRDATTSLAARTFFEHDWRCNNDWAKTDCKKKGGEWACDKSCVCIEKPVECGTYCPLRSLKKVACELKWGYDFNDDNCACEKEKKDDPKPTPKPTPTTTKPAPPPPTTTHPAPPPPDKCPNKDHLSALCAKDQGTFNYDTCKCESPKCPDCDGQGKDCNDKGGKWDDSKCKCDMPTPPPPPAPSYPTHPTPSPPKTEEPKQTCGSWWSIWVCKLKGKSCDGGCNCY